MPLENTDAEERITRETMIGWIEHWGESYDDVRPDDGAMRLAEKLNDETCTALRDAFGEKSAFLEQLARTLLLC